MSGETNLNKLLREMSPELNVGEYVFVTVQNDETIEGAEVLGKFKEQEGTTLILKKEAADRLGLAYAFVASWISLKVHSSLAAVGLTAAFSAALAEQQISCNIIAGYYHDHIFVDTKDVQKAMNVLKKLSKNNN